MVKSHLLVVCGLGFSGKKFGYQIYIYSEYVSEDLGSGVAHSRPPLTKCFPRFSDHQFRLFYEILDTLFQLTG